MKTSIGIILTGLGALLMWIPYVNSHSLSQDHEICNSSLGQLAQVLNQQVGTDCSYVNLGWIAAIALMAIGVIIVLISTIKNQVE